MFKHGNPKFKIQVFSNKTVWVYTGKKTNLNLHFQKKCAQLCNCHNTVHILNKTNSLQLHMHLCEADLSGTLS